MSKPDIKAFLDSDGRLKQHPSKRQKTFLALEYLAGKFENGRRYTEKEVNDILSEWHTFRDPATLRRELYDWRFLDRTADGSAYWLEETPPEFKN